MGKSIEQFFNRIADALSILDFSYIISGGVGYLILYWILYQCDSAFVVVTASLSSSLFAIGSMLIAYALGLVTSSLGNWIRQICTRISCIHFNFNNEWESVFRSLNKEPHGADEKERKVLYTQLWNQLYKENEDSKRRLDFINKYWVMQKVHEGLMVDSFIAAIATLIMTFNNHIMKWGPCVLVAILLLIASFVFAREARKCAQAQLYEVIIAYFTFVQETTNEEGQA